MSSYVRASVATLTASFLDDGSVPLVPLNTNYPTVQVSDPSGAVAASGVATATGTPGLWTWAWSVRADATLGSNWVVRWDITDVGLNTHTQTITFSVVDQIEEPDSLDRTGGYLTMKSQNERLLWQSATVPNALELTLLDEAGTAVWTAAKTLATLTHVTADGYETYYWDTTASADHADEGQYMAVWRYRTGVSTPWQTQTQWLIVPYHIFWQLEPHLTLLIDKLHKNTNTPLSYMPIEKWQGFNQGLSILNSVHPLTAWTEGNVPCSFNTWWIFAAGLFLLNSRQLLEIEVSHDLSSQTVNLTYDHASPLGEVIQRIESYLWEKLLPAKLAAYRASAGPGVVAVRPLRLNYRNRVYRAGTATTGVSDFPAILGRLGLWV